MNRELVVATKNQGKMREIRELLEDLNINITSLADYPDAPNIIEDGKTFSENAIKKAIVIAEYTEKLTLGEDSGIEIIALHNAPGIYSARYAGINATDEQNNEKMIKELANVPAEKRQARYCCAVALVDQEHTVYVTEGTCEGTIATEARGHNGFGYDPYFLIPEYNRTFGELDPSIKAAISHRSIALRKVKLSLKKYFQT